MRFATAVIERYKRRETSMEEAIIEVHLAGVSTRRIEDVSKILWGAGVSTGMVASIAEVFPWTRFEIRIPCDNDGFILLRCPHCDELFKLTAENIESDETLDIYCPSCGLCANNFLTQNVIDLALAKTSNYAMYVIAQQLQSFAKKTATVSFDSSSKPITKGSRSHQSGRRLKPCRSQPAMIAGKKPRSHRPSPCRHTRA